MLMALGNGHVLTNTLLVAGYLILKLVKFWSEQNQMQSLVNSRVRTVQPYSICSVISQDSSIQSAMLFFNAWILRN